MATNISHWLKVQSRWFKNYMFAKKCILIRFGALKYITFIISYHILFRHILLFGCWIFSIPFGCQTVWIKIRPNILSGLIWVQTVCKGYQQTTKVAPSEKRVKYKTSSVDDSTFWLKPWLELLSFVKQFGSRSGPTFYQQRLSADIAGKE